LAICGLLFAGISVAQAEPGAHAPFEANGSVIKNHDGDTITLATNDHGVLTIRLSGADAPESGQGYWKVARDYLRFLVNGTATSAWCYKHDRYDRAVCHVRVGAQDIQEALIAKGYAWYAFQFAHELDADQQAHYQEAEQRARDQRNRPATAVFPPKFRCLKMPCGRAPQICAHKGIYGHKFKGSDGLEAARPLPASPAGAETGDC
jgi:endonuclease YncB( thermonuclease family)